MNGKVAVLIGSESDRETMESANKYYEYFNIKMELKVMSAHRKPKEVSEFASSARNNGYNVLVGAAGMAAHLAGALTANSTLPVIGVPLAGGMEDGMDALLSTVQMPKGVPVATMSIGKAGQRDVPEVAAVRHRVFEMALEKGVQPRAEIMTIADAKQYLDMGVRHFSIGTDLAILHGWWKEQGEGLRRVIFDSLG